MREEGDSGDPTHVLVTGAGATAADAGASLTANALGVAYETAAEAWLEGVRPGADRVAVVSVGEQSRAAAAAAGPDAGPEAMATVASVVETVPDGSDVAGVGTLVNDYLSAWDGETTVCLDDISSLLEHTSAEAAFRFVHALRSCAAANGGRVVAGLDTADRPPHIAATFGELFDEVREA